MGAHELATSHCALPPPPPPEQLALAGGIAISRPRRRPQVLLEGNAMVICALIHASILKIGRSYVSSQEEAEFIARARAFAAK